MKDKNLTIVFTVNDKEKFKEFFEANIRPHIMPSDGQPWAITAWSRDHELHRLSLIEEAIFSHPDDKEEIIDKVLGLLDVSDYESLDDVRNSK